MAFDGLVLDQSEAVVEEPQARQAEAVGDVERASYLAVTESEIEA